MKYAKGDVMYGEEIKLHIWLENGAWANHARDNNSKLLREYVPHGVEWQTARTIAKNTISNIRFDFTGGATYYHADYIERPSWAKNMTQTAHYGHHIFYREVR